VQIDQTKAEHQSSTKAEVTGASNFLPSTIWVQSFLQAQGYIITNNSFLQDNKSAILLERNIVYCPTSKMLADLFTKPLQGALFRKFRNVILGYNHISFLHHPPCTNPCSFPHSAIEECVGTGFSPNHESTDPPNHESTDPGWTRVTHSVQIAFFRNYPGVR
jgi:hypothetical protein